MSETWARVGYAARPDRQWQVEKKHLVTAVRGELPWWQTACGMRYPDWIPHSVGDAQSYDQPCQRCLKAMEVRA